MAMDQPSPSIPVAPAVASGGRRAPHGRRVRPLAVAVAGATGVGTAALVPRGAGAGRGA